MKRALMACIGEAVKAGEVEAESLSEMEVGVQQMVYEVGHEVLRQWLEGQESNYPADQVPCACGSQAQYVRRREGVSLTLLGRVAYRRTYYVCKQCHTGYLLPIG
ncbi:MAG: hypothetical protein ABI947_18720 [Chloroflexota bacterium]